MNNTTKKSNFESSASEPNAKIATVKTLYPELSTKRQAQTDLYFVCLQTHDFSADITQDTKDKLLVNEVLNGTEEGFESRLQRLSKLQSEDEAYAYMDKSYRQETTLAFESDKAQKASDKNEEKKSNSSIENYIEQNDQDYGYDR